MDKEEADVCRKLEKQSLLDDRQCAQQPNTSGLLFCNSYYNIQKVQEAKLSLG